MTVTYLRKIFPMTWKKEYELPPQPLADKGPCPDGFHIGTKDEWTSIKTALTTLGLWDKTNFMTYLKIPSAYYLNRSNGSKNTSYGPARIWTSTMTSKDVSWCVGVDEKNAMLLSEDKPANGFSIRPMKDEPVEPDNTWTLLTTGIYWSSTLGLISITGDGGTTYITISDKNLGATNVGDNGLYYQFGNNYGFNVSPASQSGTKVNTTGYGPGNYYNSSTFVTVSGKATNWMSVDNNNIWGGLGYSFTVIFDSNDSSKGTISKNSIEVTPESTITYSNNTVNIDGNTITYTPNSGYKLYGFYYGSPSKVTRNMTIKGYFIESSETTTPLYISDNKLVKHDITNQEIDFVDISNPNNNFIIMDRNLGATAYKDEPNKTYADWYGNGYQWGNNYGFSIYNSSSMTTSSTEVDLTGYDWETPYSSSTFITLQNPYTSGTVDEYLWGNDNSEASRKGPCPNGYHIPSQAEANKLVSFFSGLGLSKGDRDNILLASNTHITYTGARGTGYGYNFWTTKYSIASDYSMYYYGQLNMISRQNNGRGYPIRPFKDTSV